MATRKRIEAVIEQARELETEQRQAASHEQMESAGRVSVDTLEGMTWHILNPLKEKGLFYVDQLQKLSVEELAAVVSGKKVLPRLMAALGRSEEYERWRGRYDVFVRNEKGEVLASYPAGDLRQIAALVGTARYFGFGSTSELRAALDDGARTDPFTGETVQFSLEDLARYRYDSDQAKEEIRQARAALKEERDEERELAAELPFQGIQQVSADDYERQLEEVTKRYASDYETRTWNQTDWDNMRILAAMKLRVMNLQRALGTLNTFKGTQMAQVARAAAEIAREVAQSVGEMRQLEDALGISLRRRREYEQRASADETFTNFVTDAKRLIAERASICYCPNCAEKQQAFRLGVAVIHFPKHVRNPSVPMTCPRCGTEFDWPLVTQAMLDAYLEAGDFRPEDAPAGMLE